MNTLTLSGNLTADAKKHTTEGGREFYSFTLAHNKVWYDKNQEKQTKTSFFDCLDSKPGHAKYLENHAKKGAHVVILASIEIFATENGDKKYLNTKLIIEDIHISPKTAKADETPAHPFND